MHLDDQMTLGHFFCGLLPRESLSHGVIGRNWIVDHRTAHMGGDVMTAGNFVHLVVGAESFFHAGTYGGSSFFTPQVRFFFIAHNSSYWTVMIHGHFLHFSCCLLLKRANKTDQFGPFVPIIIAPFIVFVNSDSCKLKIKLLYLANNINSDGEIKRRVTRRVGWLLGFYIFHLDKWTAVFLKKG